MTISMQLTLEFWLGSSQHIIIQDVVAETRLPMAVDVQDYIRQDKFVPLIVSSFVLIFQDLFKVSDFEPSGIPVKNNGIFSGHGQQRLGPIESSRI